MKNSFDWWAKGTNSKVAEVKWIVTANLSREALVAMFSHNDTNSEEFNNMQHTDYGLLLSINIYSGHYVIYLLLK